MIHVFVYPLLLLLGLHPSVLEPNLDLTIGEIRLQSELLPLLLGHVAALLELLLQHGRLVALVRLSALLRGGCNKTHVSWRRKRTRKTGGGRRGQRAGGRARVCFVAAQNPTLKGGRTCGKARATKHTTTTRKVRKAEDTNQQVF